MRYPVPGIVILFSMKILIVSRNNSILKTHSDALTAGHPHIVTDSHIAQIKNAGGAETVIVLAGDRNEAEPHVEDADIIAGFPATIPDVSNALRLTWVHSFSAGVDRVLTPYVKESDIILSNSSGIHATPIAEHLIGFMLIFTRGFYRTFQNQQKHEWGKDESLGELRGKRVLIAGAGEIGMETARLAAAFGARVSAITRSRKEKPAFIEEMGVTADLDAMLSDADFVVIALPHTDETHHFFDSSKFRVMKPTAVIMNIGRGGIINEQDLIAALNEKRLFGAALDVTEQEPLPAESPLWDMEHVIITPHHSGLSDQYMNRAIALFTKNLYAFLAGKPLPTQVDKRLGY